MNLTKSEFWDNRIEADFSAFFNLDLELAYWNEVPNKYKQGLVIRTSTESDRSTLMAYVPTHFVDGHDICIGFDDSIVFLKKFKQSYKSICKNQEEFAERYTRFLEKYINKIHNISLSSKLKPSVIAEEFLGEPIDLLNIENFNKSLWGLPSALKKALNKERGLLHYEFAYGSNRFHILKFSLDEVRAKLSERDVLHFDKYYAKYQKKEIKGDALKGVILANIQKEISSVDSGDLKAVNAKFLEIKNRYDYKLLGQSQGIATQMLGFFGVKTSSVQALDKWMNFTYPDLMQSSVSSNKL